MKITEVLNNPLEWEWSATDGGTIATFNVGGQITYIIKFYYNKDIPDLREIIFGMYKENNPYKKDDTVKDKFDQSDSHITNTGNEFKVFATVADIIKAYINKDNTFSGFIFEADESSRQKLYDRMLGLFKSQGFPATISGQQPYKYGLTYLAAKTEEDLERFKGVVRLDQPRG